MKRKYKHSPSISVRSETYAAMQVFADANSALGRDHHLGKRRMTLEHVVKLACPDILGGDK